MSKGYYRCDRHRLLNLPDTRGAMQRWRNVGWSVGLAIIGQAQKETPTIFQISFTSHPTIAAIQYVRDSVVKITQIGGGKAVGRGRNCWERYMDIGMSIGLSTEFEQPYEASFETYKRAWYIITFSFTHIYNIYFNK
jgi:hypothetical protein